MSKERTPNPKWSGTPAHKAWDEGYAAALSDMAGIEPKGRRSAPGWLENLYVSEARREDR